MKKRFFATLATLIGLLMVGCNCSDEIIEKQSPIIISQSLVNGAIDVSVAPQNIHILFDRTIKAGDLSKLTFEPEVTFEVEVKESALKIVTTEEMAYEAVYTFTIGEGVVLDKLTGGSNGERKITFTTEEAPYSPPSQPTYDLVVSDALEMAHRLYAHLWTLKGNYTLSGASMNEMWSKSDCDWVYLATGTYPAVASFDYHYLHLSPSSVIDYTAASATMEEWWNEGGLISSTWFWMVPTEQGSKKYTLNNSETTLIVNNLFIEGTWENKMMVADLKKMTDILLMLQEKGIVVLWRPLPRASMVKNNTKTPLYWWSNCGSKAYKKLWRYMFDYFKESGVKNLIWVWTTMNNDTEYYPGDEWVDIISSELFNKSNATDCRNYWRTMNSWFPHKVLWLSSVGAVAPIGEQLDAGAVWGGFETAFDAQNSGNANYAHQYASSAWWQAAFDDERIISRDELPF